MNIELLHPLRDLDQLPYFYPIDTRELYEKNLLIQAAEWSWRDRSIRYDLNTQGYRCEEWSSIDWNSSILCFGCSMTFGIGVDTDQTWPHYLSLVSGHPCVNLAQPGASVAFNWANSVKLLAQGIRPRAVIYYWPDYSRSFEFVEGLRTVNWGSWIKPQLSPGQLGHVGSAWAVNPVHARAMSLLYMQSLNWSCPRLDLTWSPDPLPGQQHHLVKLDHARDLRHPGPVSNQQFAQDVCAQLKI